MPVTYVNRYLDTYYLHVGRTKTGKPKYWFSTKADGDLVEAIPEGYEVYENPDAQVYLQKAAADRDPGRGHRGRGGLETLRTRPELPRRCPPGGHHRLPFKAGQHVPENAAVHTGRQEGPDLPSPALVFQGVYRRLDRSMGVRECRGIAGSGPDVLPTPRSGFLGSSVFKCKTSRIGPSGPWPSGGCARSSSRSLATPDSSPGSIGPTDSSLTSVHRYAW